MGKLRLVAWLRRGSLAANAIVAATAFAAAPLPAEVAEPRRPAPQSQGNQPQFFFSPWTTFCLKGQEPNARVVCFTGKDARIELGHPSAAAPTDPKTFEEQQQRLNEELARRAEDARKRLNQFLDPSNR